MTPGPVKSELTVTAPGKPCFRKPFTGSDPARPPGRSGGPRSDPANGVTPCENGTPDPTPQTTPTPTPRSPSARQAPPRGYAVARLSGGIPLRHRLDNHIDELLCSIRRTLSPTLLGFAFVSWSIRTCVDEEGRLLICLPYPLQQDVPFSRTLLPPHIGDDRRKALRGQLYERVFCR